ncbi:MAG: ribosome biogenesis GTPase Der [Brevinematia bacterium]
MKDLPLVSIVGRPNVGKSSLFNLLIGKRKSIVDEKEGVTRDANTEMVNYEDMHFILSDTAGYLNNSDLLNKVVQEKLKEIIENSDVVIFMVDGREIHPLDYELSKILKKLDKKVIVVANKLDNREMEALAIQFFSLGFDVVIPFSVTHKRGKTELLEKLSLALEEMKKTKKSIIPEMNGEIKIAIVGKPNVGKSMLVNAILGYERCFVSEIAGTTRDAIDDVIKYNDRFIRLIDTAGLRKKSRVEEDIEYYSNVRAIQSIERSDVVIQLLDPTMPISHQDKTITETVVSRGKSIVLAYNKWDLISEKKEENYFLMEEYRKKVYSELPAYPYIPVEFVSAKEKYKINRLLNTALRVYENSIYRVQTSVLNEWLQRNIKESNLNYPVSDLKVYYVTQVDVSPPEFVFFINHKKHLRKDYKRFLENRLRLAFEFTGVPIEINFREKEE